MDLFYNSYHCWVCEGCRTLNVTCAGSCTLLIKLPFVAKTEHSLVIPIISKYWLLHLSMGVLANAYVYSFVHGEALTPFRVLLIPPVGGARV